MLLKAEFRIDIGESNHVAVSLNLRENAGGGDRFGTPISLDDWHLLEMAEIGDFVAAINYEEVVIQLWPIMLREIFDRSRHGLKGCWENTYGVDLLSG